MFDFLSSIKKKTLPNNSYLEEIKDIQPIKDENLFYSEDKFITIYNEGLKSFKTCTSIHKPEKSYLEYSASKFIEAINLKSTKPEPFICLSYIYYIMEQDELTLKYFKIATLLDSDGKNDKFLNKIRNLIS